MADEQEHALITWARKQPSWQQHALKLLVKYGSAHAIPEDEKTEVKKILTAEAKGEKPDFTPIQTSDISNASPTHPKTYLKSLGPVSNIDKLASDQEPFEFVNPNGLTVIFGNNGSGKSGYARILKNLCRSHGYVQPLRGDATSGTETGWLANLTYAEKEQASDETPKPLTWIEGERKKAKTDPEYTPLERIAFFDSHVANTYVDRDRTLFYLPPEIRLYEEIAVLAGEFRDAVDLKTKELKRQYPNLPETTEGTLVHSTLSKLKLDNARNISEEKINAICVLSAEEQKELKDLRDRKSRTPAQQKTVVETAMSVIVRLNSDTEKIVQAIGSEALQQLCDSHRIYENKKSIAEHGVASLAKNMPISDGIGSGVWFEMFKAARTFAGSIFPDATPPPIANGDHCVLCHQDLNDDASERLRLFDAFMDNTLQVEAEKVNEAFNRNLKVISSLPELDVEAIKQQLRPYADLSDMKKQNSENIISDMQTISSRLTNVKTLIKVNHFDDLQSLIDEDLTLKANFNDLLSEVEVDARNLNRLIERGDTGLSTENQNRLAELEAKSLCVSQKQNIEKYFKNSKQILLLNACKRLLTTNHVTIQSRNRSDTLFSNALQTRYKNEIEKLHLRYLNVNVDNRVSKGEQKVEMNITGVQRGEANSGILSEGEQRAIALAGFLTEVNEVETGHAIILDDPVSSLDWDRKALIAERLAEEAKQRQVIIFTHDFSFVLQLEKFSNDKNRRNQEPFWGQLWIAKQSTGIELQFGITGETAVAWESKKVKQRLGDIDNEIKQLEKDALIADGSGLSSFERQSSNIAKRLRQAWERAVEEVALNDAVRRLSPSVMTTRLENVQFDCNTDYKILHEGMSSISTLAHDNPEDGGSAVPTLSQLKQNKSLLENWIQSFKDKRSALNSGGNDVSGT